MIHRFGELEIDQAQGAIRRRGQVVPLTPKPFAVLDYLLSNTGRVVSKEEIVEAVWGGQAISDEAIYSAIRSVRKAIDASGQETHIKTVYGRGWRFVSGVDAPATVSGVQAHAESAGLYPPSIAALEFDCMADDPRLRFIADSLVDDILTMMFRFRDVRVVSRSSASSITARDLTVKEIGERLGARFVLEGSLRPTQSGVRVNVRIIDADDDTQVWAGQYELLAKQMAESQEDVARSVVTSSIAVISDHLLRLCNYKDLDALSPWECFLRGRFLLGKFDPQLQDEAIRLFERGIALNPKFATLYAALSYALNTKHKSAKFFAVAPGQPDRRTDARMHAHALAQKAVEMEPNVPFGWMSLARSHLGLGEMDGAIAAANRSLELNPNYGWAHFILGFCYWPLDRAEDALEAFDKALNTLTHDSFQWAISGGKGCALMVLGRYEEALDLVRQAQVHPHSDHFALCAEVCSLSHLGRHQEAQSALQRSQQLVPEFGLALIEHDQPLPDPKVRTIIADGLRLAADCSNTAEPV